jgi:CDP-glucose 4,6-dehydratase
MALTGTSFWTGRRVLVTGHTGFKGAWLSLWLSRRGADVVGLSLPPESPDGAFSALRPWDDLESHFADLRDGAALEQVVTASAPEIVFHLAAQSLVRRGWADPVGTYAVNVVGTAHLLEAVARAGCVRAVVVVTSDKVYANVGSGAPFVEDSPLGGGDPYSASKAAAELVVQAWRNGNPKVAVATGRAGNVIGGGDVARDRLLPDAWLALREGTDLVLRNPGSTRPWQFVLEPLAGYILMAERLVAEPEGGPPALIFGPPATGCWAVARVADTVLAAWGSGRWVDGYKAGAPPEARALSLDAGLASRTLGWRPRLDVDGAIRWTVDWWRAAASGASLRSLAAAQIRAYEDLLG